MKKIFTLLSLGASLAFVAQTQTFSVYKTAPNGAVIQTIANGDSYTEGTVANGAAHETRILLKNNATTTQTFNVVRKVLSQTPALILDNSANTPNTYFCFGNTCFGSATNEPDPTNHTILAATGQTFTNNGLTIADNSAASSEPFVIYFVEGSTQGNYTVQYRIFNLDPAKPNDTLSFKVLYNQTYTGIKTQSKASDLVSDIYPNPAGSSSKLFIDLAKDDELKFQIYNNLGSLIYSGNKQKYTAGKNALPVDLELNNGLYFVTISSNSATTTKRLIINK